MRREFLFASIIVVAGNFIGGLYYPQIHFSWILFGPLLILGWIDYFQVRHAIRRNYPVFGRFRYIFEAIRPEINQYFVESNSDGVPFSREQRSVVYQRSKKALDTLPFGTQKDVYKPGYEWVNHSMLAVDVDREEMRVLVGGPDCKKPYSASVLNISAMSYGSLSKNAVLALNGGAKEGGFAHNTGEGGISPYHLEPGGDLIWQIGTGYFGCRNDSGGFCEENFEKKAALPSVKMIEIKLSQGAKPGHGGILPGAKVTEEVAQIRGVPVGKDVNSPPNHTAFSTPTEMMNFVKRLRELSGGKPIGIKLCVGKRREFLSICKAMEKTGITPDYVAVDGGEGGTGAAPIEFSNHIGSPGIEALIFIRNALLGFSVRDRVSVFASGKVITGFGMLKLMALGADAVYSARGMMLALGCIQALRCNSNHCPAGVATQKPYLVEGLVVPSKRKRVYQFHKETVDSLADILGAMGLSLPDDLRPWHIMRRTAPNEIKNYNEIYEFLGKGDLLNGKVPKSYHRALEAASASSFRNLNY